MDEEMYAMVRSQVQKLQLGRQKAPERVVCEMLLRDLQGVRERQGRCFKGTMPSKKKNVMCRIMKGEENRTGKPELGSLGDTP